MRLCGACVCVDESNAKKADVVRNLRGNNKRKINKENVTGSDISRVIKTLKMRKERLMKM